MPELKLDATIELNRAVRERNGIALGMAKTIERGEALIASLTQQVEYLDKYAQGLAEQLQGQAQEANAKEEREKYLLKEIEKLHRTEADLKDERAQLVREIWVLTGHDLADLPQDEALRAFIAEAQKEE